MFFFFKYVKDLHIIVLKKKNVTIQTMRFRSRSSYSRRLDYPNNQFQAWRLHKRITT
jgi:hypothetical protein